MPTIDRRIDVDVPIERVVAVLDDPPRLAEYGPNVERADVVRCEGRPGDAFRVVYSVLGVCFPLTFAVTDHARPTAIAAQVEGGMTGSWARIEYALPGGLLGRAADAVLVERLNEKNAERLLENLKLVAEAAPAAP